MAKDDNILNQCVCIGIIVFMFIIGLISLSGAIERSTELECPLYVEGEITEMHVITPSWLSSRYFIQLNDTKKEYEVCSTDYILLNVGDYIRIYQNYTIETVI